MLAFLKRSRQALERDLAGSPRRHWISAATYGQLAVTLPLARAHLRGRLLPLGWLKVLWYRRKIDRVRVFALGVKPEHQHTGVAAKFYECHFDAAEATPQTWGEMGWILETNTAMNRGMEGMGGKVVRRYRLYERELGEPSGATQAAAAELVAAP